MHALCTYMYVCEESVRFICSVLWLVLVSAFSVNSKEFFCSVSQGTMTSLFFSGAEVYPLG